MLSAETDSTEPALSVSLFCHLASIILCALILSETLAIYKSFTYLLIGVNMLYFSFVHTYILYNNEIYANTYTPYLDKLMKLNNYLKFCSKKRVTVEILSCMLTTIFYLLPNFTVFKFFLLLRNVFIIKNYCQIFIIIIYLRTIKFMIMIQEIKIICTCQLLLSIIVLRQ